MFNIRRKGIWFFLLIVVVIISVTSCKKTIDLSEKNITKIEEKANFLFLQHNVVKGLKVIPKKEWGERISQLCPLKVFIEKRGLFIKLEQGFVEEEGIFILRKKSGYIPSNGTDPSFKLIYGNTYYYKVKG